MTAGVRKLGPDVANYLGKLRTTLTAVVGDYAEVPRYKTALATDAICQAVGRAKKPWDVFEAVQVAQVTSPPGMGEVFRQAAKVHAALDQVRLDVFENLGRVRDEPWAGSGEDPSGPDSGCTESR